ncbi:YbjN domain-containing protein [Egicoccus halophilus]|uniref:Sensory transduction regulator n=1 Tax=Egicoccus halophilus TaxID=1670830 RepID=A0A8J3EVM3_9ACTN|nr:YbjN domain-containing protein [Egicoccus halophilus]GGI09463.1 hypothetical protein GCM10011354_34200 [Egicoccus halophilus]
MNDGKAGTSRRRSGLAWLVRMLDASDLDVRVLPELATAVFPHAGQHGSWEVYCRSGDPAPQVAVYSLHPREVPARHRAAMATLLTRANYGLLIGNFELDLADGELRFKTSLDHGADQLTGTLLASLIEHNVAAFDRYLPALDAVLDGEVEEADRRLQVAEADAT